MEGAQKSEKEKEARQMPARHVRERERERENFTFVTVLFAASAEERPHGAQGLSALPRDRE